MRATLTVFLFVLCGIWTSRALAIKPQGYENLKPGEKLFYDTFLAPDAEYVVDAWALNMLARNRPEYTPNNWGSLLDETSYVRLVRVHPQLAQMVKTGNDYRVTYLDRIQNAGDDFIFNQNGIDRRVQQTVRDSFLATLALARKKPTGKVDLNLAEILARQTVEQRFGYPSGKSERDWDRNARNLKAALVDYYQEDFRREQNNNALPEKIFAHWRAAEIERLKEQVSRLGVDAPKSLTGDKYGADYVDRVRGEKRAQLLSAIAALEKLSVKDQKNYLDSLDRNLLAENRAQKVNETGYFGDGDRVGRGRTAVRIKWIWDLHWWGEKQAGGNTVEAKYWAERRKRAKHFGLPDVGTVLQMSDRLAEVQTGGGKGEPGPPRPLKQIQDHREIETNSPDAKRAGEHYRIYPGQSSLSEIPTLFRELRPYESKQTDGPYRMQRGWFSKPSFQLVTAMNHAPKYGIVDVPSTDGHEVWVDKLFAVDPATGERKLLAAGIDYTLEQNKNKKVFIRFKNGRAPEEVAFVASYFKNRGAPKLVNASELRLDATELANLRAEIPKMRAAGFEPMAKAIEKLTAFGEKQPVTAADVARVVIKDQAMGSYLPGEKQMLADRNPYAAYRQFKNADGVFCASCLPLSDLIAGILRRTLRERPGIDFTDGYGYSRDPDKLVLTGNDQHAFLEIRHGSDLMVIDEKPDRFDPRSPRPGGEPAEMNMHELIEMIAKQYAQEKEAMSPEMHQAFLKERKLRQKLNDRIRARLGDLDTAREGIGKAAEATGLAKFPDRGLPHEKATDLADTVRRYVEGKLSMTSAIAQVSKIALVEPSTLSDEAEALHDTLLRAKKKILSDAAEHLRGTRNPAADRHAGYLDDLMMRPTRLMLDLLAPEPTDTEAKAGAARWIPFLAHDPQEIIRHLGQSANEACLRGWAVGQ